MFPGGNFHEELLKRRKANTYKERRKEGRTMHTKASKTAITVASIALVFNAMAIAMPQWRTSWVALIGYGGRRHWGLLGVQGRKLQMHHTLFEDNCRWYGHLLLGNSCLSPICKWYLLKCNVYFDFCIYSYSAAFVIILALIIHALCLYWTCLLSGRSLRWAATWWPVAALLHISATVFWIIVTEGAFDQLDEESWYPVPTPGAAFFLACVGGLGHLVCVWLAFSLKSTWPEVDPDNPSQFISDSEDQEDDDDDDQEAVMDAAPMPQYGAMPPKAGSMPPLRSSEKGSFTSAMPAMPAALTPAAPEEPQSEWYYLDSKNNQQGPYSVSLMKGWFAEGHFETDLQLRRKDETDFTPLGDGSRLV